MSQRKEHVLGVRVTPDELAALNETAQQERRTISDMVRLLLTDGIAAKRAAQQQEQGARV